MYRYLTENILTVSTVAVFLLLGVILLAIMPPVGMMTHSKDIDSLNKSLAKQEKVSIAGLLAEGRYKCCMNEPCSRCFAKAKNHDKELVCDCMVDIYNGKHPCGECIGEILEGEGNPLMAEYFAVAIAEKLGQQHLPMLKQIIAEQYPNMPVEKQL